MSTDEIDATGQTPNYTRRRFNPCACDAARGWCNCPNDGPDITHGGNSVEDGEHTRGGFPRRCSTRQEGLAK